jgi:hypothetical protein
VEDLVEAQVKTEVLVEQVQLMVELVDLAVEEMAEVLEIQEDLVQITVLMELEEFY